MSTAGRKIERAERGNDGNNTGPSLRRDRRNRKSPARLSEGRVERRSKPSKNRDNRARAEPNQTTAAGRENVPGREKDERGQNTNEC